MAFNDEVRDLANDLEELLMFRHFEERTDSQQALLMALNDFFEAAE